MPYRRSTMPAIVPDADALTSAMVGIGMGFAAHPAPAPNIEDTLLFASIEAMENDDWRVLAVLTTWMEVHANWVNVDRLTKLVKGQPSQRVTAFWAAIARWRAADHRFARLGERPVPSDRTELLRVGTEFQVRRHGEDPRFVGGPLVVPAIVLRNRAADVLSPASLAQRHAAYRWRVIIGPSYRADMWAALETDPMLSAAELARSTYGSFATAWSVKRGFGIVASPEGTHAGRATRSRRVRKV